jgi:hypothetical protein
MVGSGICSSIHRRMPTDTHAGAEANPGSGPYSLFCALSHSDCHCRTNIYRHTLSAAYRHAHSGAPDGNAAPHRNAISHPTREHRDAYAHSLHKDPISNTNAQAAHADAYEHLSFSIGPSGLARSLASLSQLPEGACLYRRQRHRRRGQSFGGRAAGML